MTARPWCWLLLVVTLSGACGDGRTVADAAPADGSRPDATPDGASPRDAGSIDTLVVGEWNLNWFGSGDYGPFDLDLQQQNVTTVLERNPAPLWALEEVVDARRLAAVAADIGGYQYVLAQDTSVDNHRDFRGTQMTGILYDPAVITLRSAKIVLGSDYYNFAERPPLEVALDVRMTTGTVPLTILVLHMKAYDDASSYDRRASAAMELKTYLDTNHPGDRVLVAGDFNDDLDTSLRSGSPSPYASFVSDAADYVFPTLLFTEMHFGTQVDSRGDPIDHQMVTDELAPTVVDGSPAVIRPSIGSYSDTTSDHYPIQVTYALR